MRQELATAYQRIADITIDSTEVEQVSMRAESLMYMVENPPEELEVLHGTAESCLREYPSHIHWDGTIVERNNDITCS